MMIKGFVAAFATIIVLDYIWLGYVVRKFYAKNLAHIARVQGDRFEVTYWAGGVVYAFLALGIVFFVLPKIAASDSALWAWVVGAIFGLVVYGVYDFTNHSVMDWPLNVSLADVAWGGMVCGLATLAARAAESWG